MIYIITHKEFDDAIVDNNYYTVLHVGENRFCRNTYLRDDVGDNISYKNKYYCELTGLYWIWKNDLVTDNEITGIVHYRRYFTSKHDDFCYAYFNRKPKILGYNNIKAIISKGYVIVPQKTHRVRTVYRFYADHHHKQDLDYLRMAVKNVHPEYLCSFDKVMRSHAIYEGNMMICSRKMLVSYCEWLFSIIIECESMIDFSKYKDTYQQRVIGFLSERLLKVWIDYNGIKCKEYPVFNTEVRKKTILSRNINRIKELFEKLVVVQFKNGRVEK